MSIGFMGDGKPSNKQPKQPKRPKSVRGFKTKKIVTEHYGRKDVSFERVPRSGYGSAFFSLFTLFLAILVLFNIVTGSGYSGYKTAVGNLYILTESVGNFVGAIVDGFNILNKTVTDSLTDIYIDGEKIEVLDNLVILTRDDIKIVCCTPKSSVIHATTEFIVFESNHPDYKIGDNVGITWWFGWTLSNLEYNIFNRHKIRYMSREFVSYDEYMKGE